MIGNAKERGCHYFFEDETDSRKQVQSTCFQPISVSSDKCYSCIDYDIQAFII